MMTSDPGKAGATEDPIDAARRWVVRLRSGDVSQDDIEALNRWRAESMSHRTAFAFANAQWNVLRQAAHNVEAADVAARERSMLTRRAWIGGALAASFGGATYLAVRPPFDLWPSLSELNADYRTDVGERRQINVAEDVSVELNTRTSVVAGAGADAQGLTLISGEIAVTTGRTGAKLQQPFVVAAGAGRVSALRATFDLRRDGQEVRVVCLDGAVSIACGQDTVSLDGGQYVDYGADGLSNVKPSESRAVDAWRQGLLVFENQPLAHVVSEINRYRRGRIVLTSARIGGLPLDATFRLDRIDEVVPKLTHLFSLKVRTLPGGVVLLS
jgi:transmembrane sensor